MKTIPALMAFLSVIYCPAVFAQNIESSSSMDSARSHDTNIPEKARRLIEAYPGLKLKYEDNQIIFSDGSSMIYDDGVAKDYIRMLDNADIEDMFSIEYSTTTTPSYLQDAGRIRCEAFFKKVYGGNAKSVKKTLVDVPWFGTRVKFTQINGAADQLKKVADEIQNNHPELIPYMESSGTFYWRKVRHSQRLSSHSYGIAIDIAVKQSDYWKWGNPRATETDKIDYKNRIPLTLVEIFEKHGFVWGGRWYHYDTMHFEYRPEIIQNR